MEPITLIALTTKRPPGERSEDHRTFGEPGVRPPSAAPTLLSSENAARTKSNVESTGLVGSPMKPWELITAANDDSDDLAYGLQRPFPMDDEELPRSTLPNANEVWKHYLASVQAILHDVAKVDAWKSHLIRIREWCRAPNGTDIFLAELKFDVDNTEPHDEVPAEQRHLAYLIHGTPEGVFWPTVGWMIDTSQIVELLALCKADEAPKFEFIHGQLPNFFSATDLGDISIE